VLNSVDGNSGSLLMLFFFEFWVYDARLFDVCLGGLLFSTTPSPSSCFLSASRCLNGAGACTWKTEEGACVMENENRAQEAV